jgi:hypothetical protein
MRVGVPASVAETQPPHAKACLATGTREMARDRNHAQHGELMCGDRRDADLSAAMQDQGRCPDGRNGTAFADESRRNLTGVRDIDFARAHAGFGPLSDGWCWLILAQVIRDP